MAIGGNIAIESISLNELNGMFNLPSGRYVYKRSIYNQKITNNIKNKRYHLIGFGEIHPDFTEDTKGQTITFNIDMNPQAVANSLKPVETELKKAIISDLQLFYRKDHRKYTTNNGEIIKMKEIKFDEHSLEFKLYITVSNLSKTDFTYLYNYELKFNDGQYIYHSQGSLSKLLINLKDDLGEQIIKKEMYRHINEFSFQKVKTIFEKKQLDQLKNVAPVLSSLDGKFKLANVDLNYVLNHSLAKRATNPNGQINQEILDQYLEGKSDGSIAWDLGECLLTYRNQQKNSKFHKGIDYGRSLLISLFTTLTPGVGLYNSLRSVITGSGIAKTKSFSQARIKDNDIQKIEEYTLSRAPSFCDATLSIFGAVHQISSLLSFPPNPFSIFGTIYQTITCLHETSLIHSGKLSIPTAIMDADISMTDILENRHIKKISNHLTNEYGYYRDWCYIDDKNEVNKLIVNKRIDCSTEDQEFNIKTTSRSRI